jgi:hypothetical protein
MDFVVKETDVYFLIMVKVNHANILYSLQFDFVY